MGMMAFRRSLSSTADILNRRGLRLRPSYRHIGNHDESVDSPPHQPQFASPSRFLHAAAYSSTSNAAAVSRLIRSRSFAAAPFGFGFRHSSPSPRWISNSSAGAADHSLASKIVAGEQMTLDVASQIPPDLSEVAIAAADSAYPVAAIQHLIDITHTFTGLNWWASIALTTLLLKLATRQIYRITAYEEDPNSRPALIALATEATIAFSYIRALINMAERVPSFHTGGALWFVDLTTVSLALPLLHVFFWGCREATTQELPNKLYFTDTCYPTMLLAATIGVPQAMYIHWITTEIFYIYDASARSRKPAIKKLLPSSTEKESNNSDKEGNN